MCVSPRLVAAPLGEPCPCDRDQVPMGRGRDSLVSKLFSKIYHFEIICLYLIDVGAEFAGWVKTDGEQG